MLGHKWSSYIWRGRKERGPLRNVTVQDGAYLSTIAQKVMAVIIRRGRGGGINYKQQEHWPRCVGTCARIYIYIYPSITRIYLSYYFFFSSYSFEQYSKVISFSTNLSIKFHDSSKLLSQRNRTNWIFGKRIYKSIVFHLNVSSCIPETFDTRTILIIESHCEKKKKKKEKTNYHLRLSQLLPSDDRFNKPSSISPISPQQRLAAVSTRGRGGRSFPTRFFFVRSSVIATRLPLLRLENELRKWAAHGLSPRTRQTRLEERERRAEKVSYRSWARGRSLIIRWPKARWNAAELLTDSILLLDPFFRPEEEHADEFILFFDGWMLVRFENSRRRCRVTMFRNARCEIEWKPNGNDTMKNSSRWLETLCLSWDNIDCIYIFCLFAEIYIHIYVLL